MPMAGKTATCSIHGLMSCSTSSSSLAVGVLRHFESTRQPGGKRRWFSKPATNRHDCLHGHIGRARQLLLKVHDRWANSLWVLLDSAAQDEDDVLPECRPQFTNPIDI